MDEEDEEAESISDDHIYSTFKKLHKSLKMMNIDPYKEEKPYGFIALKKLKDVIEIINLLKSNNL